ncbi:hypothetical protein RJ640_008276, partial [Escallonia rubra]
LYTGFLFSYSHSALPTTRQALVADITGASSSIAMEMVPVKAPRCLSYSVVVSDPSFSKVWVVGFVKHKHPSKPFDCFGFNFII